MIQSRIVYSSLSLIIVIMILCMSRPGFMFKTDGTLKDFGFGNDETLYSLSSISLVVSILLFYFFSLMDMIFSKD
jgi:hypothetical protein